MNNARSIARNSLIQLGGRGITMAASLITIALVARYLGPHRYGQYQLILAILLLVNVSDFGIATVAIRHLAVGGRTADHIMGNVLTIRLALGIAAAVGAISLSFALQYPPDVKRAMAIASLSFLLMIFSGSFNAAFAAHLRMEYAVAGNVAQAVTLLAGVATVVATGRGLVSLLIAYDAAILANSLVCLYFGTRFARLRFTYDHAYTRELMRDAAPIMIAGLMINAYDRVDVLMLKIFTDSPSVGYYGFAYRLIDLAAPLSFIFVNSIYPLLSAHHAKGEMGEFKRLYQRSHDFLSLAGMSISTGVIIFAPHIVRIIGGEEYAAAATSLRVLAFAFALIWLSNLVNYSLIAVGKQGVLFWAACVGLLVNVSVNLVMIPMYGKEGAAATTALTEAVILLAGLVVLSRYMGDRPSFWVAGRLLPVAGVTAIAGYALPLPWVVEAGVLAMLFGVGVAAVRVVSPKDLSALVRRKSAESVVISKTAEAGT
jgi:O-antigen/teichoic acid export membrane protein